MLYVPSITLVALRFQRNRAMAIFAATTGTALVRFCHRCATFLTNLSLQFFRWYHFSDHFFHHGGKTCTGLCLGDSRAWLYITLAELLAALAIILPTVSNKPLQNPRPLMTPPLWHFVLPCFPCGWHTGFRSCFLRLRSSKMVQILPLPSTSWLFVMLLQSLDGLLRCLFVVRLVQRGLWQLSPCRQQPSFLLGPV